MVVLIVIAILMTITLGLAARVTQGGKQTLTENTIRALDQVLTTYKADTGVRPPSTFKDEADREFPMIDARLTSAADTDPPDSSLALFLLEASRKSGDVDALLKGIDPKVIKKLPLVTSVSGAGPEIDGVVVTELITVVDGWDHPIRFVHPSFDGGAGDFFHGGSVSGATGRPATIDVGSLQYRRSYRPFDPDTVGSDAVGDADEGICIGKNPYFYSAGADGDPGTRQDNVYSVEPTFPEDTADLK
jgi:type II secretory pathway pseudopilin PulG